MRGYALARRRAGSNPGGGGSPTFLSLTNAIASGRPTSLSTTPTSQRKPFTTWAQFTSLLSGCQPGDYIYYAGTSGTPLNVSSSSASAYILSNVKPAGLVTLDFGTPPTIWTPGDTGNYVKFAYTGSTIGFSGLYVHDISNLAIYGGTYTSGLNGGSAITMYSNSNCYFLDAYVNVAGGSGILCSGQTTSGALGSIANLKMRLEVNRFAMNPTNADPHLDKGSGVHGAIMHGAQAAFSNCEIAIYAHDPLRPGEVVNGIAYPEGGGGSAIEIGNDTGGPITGNKYYVLAENLLMNCTGTNPGSNGNKQTGGNAVNLWGSLHIDGDQFIWVEGNNLSGQVIHATGENWKLGSPPIEVVHGRHSNTNQAWPNNSLSSQTDPYNRQYTIVYDADVL